MSAAATGDLQGSGEWVEPEPTLCIRPLSVDVLVGSLQPGYADGKADATLLNFPQHICQPDEHTLLIADRCNGRIRKLDLRTRTPTGTCPGAALLGCGCGARMHVPDVSPCPAWQVNYPRTWGAATWTMKARTQ